MENSVFLIVKLNMFYVAFLIPLPYSKDHSAGHCMSILLAYIIQWM